MQEPEKSWHFDPLTDRSDALDQNPNAPYLLLDATPRDTQKAIRFYEIYPVPGYEVSGVQVIYNRDFNLTFHAYIKQQQHKKGNAAFAPKWPSSSNAAFRQKTHDLLEKISQPYTDPDYPDVKLIPAWHGTRPETLDSIFKIGYSNLSITDSGFFGRGLYSAYEAEYSYRVYSKGALILNWVACFSALPVIDGDMSKLVGKANMGNYDAHFVPVVPKDPLSLNETKYIPWKENQKHQYTEIVVFQTAACLPRFLVTLQPTLPKQIPMAQNFEEAIALYDFSTQKANELPFKAGQSLKILDKSQGEWWSAELNGKSGHIPHNYVQVNILPPPIPSTMASQISQFSLGEETEKPPIQPNTQIIGGQHNFFQKPQDDQKQTPIFGNVDQGDSDPEKNAQSSDVAPDSDEPNSEEKCSIM